MRVNLGNSLLIAIAAGHGLLPWPQSTLSNVRCNDSLGPIPMRPSDRVWHVPPAGMTLSRHDVHVWRTSLEPSAEQVQRLRQTLAPDEVRRADRFHFDTDRKRYTVARGVLRLILSRYLSIAPNLLEFSYSSYGKPALATMPGKDWLRFNLSHSHELALYAFTRGREVGIDIEHMRANVADEAIAERYFSPREVLVFRGLPASHRRQAFFNCWTRKEAYIKARGEGLSFPLDRFDVSLAPGEPATLLATLGDPHEASRWTLQALHPGLGYAAAVVVEGHDWQLTCWQWSHSWSPSPDSST
jgi:4'-phosphopantetheinyl transferase